MKNRYETSFVYLWNKYLTKYIILTAQQCTRVQNQSHGLYLIWAITHLDHHHYVVATVSTLDVAKLSEGAKCSASSTFLDYHCTKALDGNIGNAWASNYVGNPSVTPWLQIVFAAIYRLVSTRIMQAPQDNDSVKDLQLTYSGGETELV